jgi:hypothetical protein
MVSELLRDPADAARAAVHVEGHGYRLPDLAEAQLITPLERRREQRVGLEGVNAAGVHVRPPLRPEITGLQGEPAPGPEAFQ